ILAGCSTKLIYNAAPQKIPAQRVAKKSASMSQPRHLVVGMLRLRPGFFRGAAQKILLLLLFLQILRPFWIVLLHLNALFRSQRRQMPDKVHQLPAVFAVSVLTGASKGRHSGQSHSVFNDPENFPVAALLRACHPQVRRFGIHPATHRRLAPPIVPMATRTVL